ncbi:MAG: hypothetical protein QNJ63_26515 [Calothrix sp. MO_192.B10]|nr:hypothetical protein [Calothrix sp. MO_192.B10]
MNYSTFNKLGFLTTLTTISCILSMGIIPPVNASSLQKFDGITSQQFTCMKNRRIQTLLGTYRGEVKGKNNGKITISKNSLWSSKRRRVADLTFKFNPSTQKLVLKLHKFYELGGDEEVFWNYANQYVIDPCRQ